MCYFVLSSSASESEVLLCLELEHLLMIYNLVVDTVVLLVYWNQRFSCRLCFHIVFVVGMVHIQADVNFGDVIEVLDIRLRPSVYQLKRLVYFVALPSVHYSVLAAFQCPWLFDDLPAMGCDHFSFLKRLLKHSSKEFLTLQMLF